MSLNKRITASFLDYASKELLVRIFGHEIRVRAKISTIGGFSAHADQKALLNWLASFEKPPQQTFITHGEDNASSTRQKEINNRLGWNTAIPVNAETIEICN